MASKGGFLIICALMGFSADLGRSQSGEAPNLEGKQAPPNQGGARKRGLFCTACRQPVSRRTEEGKHELSEDLGLSGGENGGLKCRGLQFPLSKLDVLISCMVPLTSAVILLNCLARKDH